MSTAEKILTKMWANTAKADAARLALQKPTEGVEKICNLVYKDDGDKYHTLNIYYPEGTCEKLPVVFDIHGGGWMYGDKELNENYCMKLASKGFAVINISYRLVPQVKLDGQVRDIFRALHWVEENAVEYPLDLDRFFITGDSAGGHLALITVVMNQDDALRTEFGARGNNLMIRAAGIVCGFNNFKRIQSIPLASGYCELIMGDDYRTSRIGWLGNICDIIGSVEELPPLFLSSSKQDFICKQTLTLEKLLKEKGKNYKLRFWNKGQEHKLEHVFNVTQPDWRESEITNDDMLDFFIKQTESPKSSVAEAIL